MNVEAAADVFIVFRDRHIVRFDPRDQLVEISHGLLSWIKNCNRKLNDNPPAEQPVTEE